MANLGASFLLRSLQFPTQNLTFGEVYGIIFGWRMVPNFAYVPEACPETGEA